MLAYKKHRGINNVLLIFKTKGVIDHQIEKEVYHHIEKILNTTFSKDGTNQWV